ncbi:Bicarbonate transport system permease protein CmpB [Posidoniimonas polymericola]|uniref:Bicarbonate transport system permease protein CmpB n=1 Tax=Posidoniimonas polymericola TaxID=2528002 RepID=A0A5C5YLL6_9BACT|nr:ABC transporter permease subunit [Posidoniimonas polymericola]TWT75843.1 Bicarbonate transport system permease protein CmpB [Posidoniimonas polymericola]
MALVLTFVAIGLLVGLSVIAGKHRTVKAIDVAGLNFLTPVVRLCYGEEPHKQLKDIGRFIVVPAFAVCVFVAAWFVVSDKIQTKSGKLPDPLETWQSAKSILQFHTRENDKQQAYNLTGEDRENKLKEVEEQLAGLQSRVDSANELVAEAKQSAADSLTEQIAPLQAKYDELKQKYDAAKKTRETELKELAATAAVQDSKTDYLAGVRSHRKRLDTEKDHLRDLKSEISALRAVKNPEVAAALAAQTAVAEERQYLQKMQDQLTSSNRTTKIEKEQAKLAAAEAKLDAAPPAELYRAATSVVRSEDRIESIATSEYAKPATLPFQTARSVLCVFFGFFLGSAIAIPIGVLCGLSKTFMAAMTPFIAAFKPVSPIVWLPVALIIVGGFIPDPDKNPLIQWLWDLPWLGKYQINPAFIASAITVALCSLWATMVNTAFGVASVEKDHINVARVLRLGFWDRLFKIVLPSALPLVFAGLRISLGVGWMVLIAAELLSSSEGIGKFVWDQFNNGASDSFAKMVVVVFVVGVIGLALDRMMIVFQRLVSFDGAPTAI